MSIFLGIGLCVASFVVGLVVGGVVTWCYSASGFDGIG